MWAGKVQSPHRAVFVTSYTRSVEVPHPADPQPPASQQQQQRRRSASLARQRLISMSDSRLGDGDCVAATFSPTTPPSAARIWRLTEFLWNGRGLTARELSCKYCDSVSESGTRRESLAVFAVRFRHLWDTMTTTTMLNGIDRVPGGNMKRWTTVPRVVA